MYSKVLNFVIYTLNCTMQTVVLAPKLIFKSNFMIKFVIDLAFEVAATVISQ